KSTFFRDKLQVYEDMITFCLERHNVEEAFAYVERAKSRALVDLLAKNFNVRARRPADPEVHQNWKKLSEELNWYYSKLNQQGLKSDQSLTQLVNEVVARERKLAELLRTIQIEDEEYTSLQEVTWSTAAQLQLLLAEDEALVEYYLVDRCEISYAPSAYVYRLCRNKQSQKTGDILIIGIPDEFTPYIGEEVKAVKELFSEAKVLLGSEATKEAFIENAPSSRLIHLA